MGCSSSSETKCDESVQINKTIKLSNGQYIPLFGLGTYESNNKEIMTNLIKKALDNGYRLIDTSKIYQNENMIGSALKEIFNEGKYKRSDIFVVTKIIPLKQQNTEEAVRGCLQDLQLEYVDLLLLHWSFVPPGDNLQFNHKPVHTQWKELEDVYNKGLTKSIGVSNFKTQGLIDLLSYSKVKPVVNQIEVHVFNQQKRLVEYCQKIGIQIMAYSPMAKYDKIVNNETLKKIAEKHKVSVAQILLQYLLQKRIIVIPKTEKPERLQENYKSLFLKLDENDNQQIQMLDSNTRVVDCQHYQNFFKGIPYFD
ncbi:hypothetical protein ABPG72_002166 [Tetrahymena utriculariae]